MLAGLRVDVDTLRGTRLGVPRLLSVLEEFGVDASFFFSVGPDNMGRHLWRLLRPAFLWKMLRTSAPSLYGWSILRCGVVGTGPDIGRAAADVIRETARRGHEVGLHAWDHQRWQSMDLSDPEAAFGELRLGYDRLGDILGAAPACSAVPAWRAPESVLAAKERLPFVYNSDCRGEGCFLPRGFRQPQVPVTLPTYDELAGRDGVHDGNYNPKLLERFRSDEPEVLCIHAEVEGIAKAGLFEDFLRRARAEGIVFARLGEVLRRRGELPVCPTAMRPFPGREGLLCVQAEPIAGER